MPEYTADWFSYSIPVWEKVVLPRLPSGTRKFLELGSHEGRSAVWFLEHAMRPGDELTCVDIWKSEPVERRFAGNVNGRARAVKGDITEALLGLVSQREKFDCVYIDGNHDGRVVLENAVLAWMVLSVGGVLVFDDYRYKIPVEYSIGAIDTHFGIDAFLSCYCLRMQVLHRTAQVAVLKTR
jgi:predicted O-methyltransferase YrrM